MANYFCELCKKWYHSDNTPAKDEFDVLDSEQESAQPEEIDEEDAF